MNERGELPQPMNGLAVDRTADSPVGLQGKRGDR